MDKQIGIFYFSGTGNTEYIVEQIAGQIKRQAPVEVYKMEKIIKDKVVIDWDRFSSIGIAYPVYGFGAPYIVYDFIKHKWGHTAKPVFLLAVCGDPHPLNRAATIQVRKMLQRRGSRVFLERIVPMPVNWVMRYPDSLSRQLFKRAEQLAPRWAGEIIAGKQELQKPGWGARLLSWVCRCEDLGAVFYGKEYIVGKTCTLCMRCIEHCPRSNIALKKGKIRFGWKCIICMRCIYYCPVQAIRLRLAQFTVPEKPYSAAQILSLTDVSAVYVTKETTGRYADFYSWLYDKE